MALQWSCALALVFGCPFLISSALTRATRARRVTWVSVRQQFEYGILSS
jgi:hypothetical protein